MTQGQKSHGRSVCSGKGPDLCLIPRPTACHRRCTAGLDPNVGALTQIFREFAPDGASAMIYGVVTEIDEIVNGIAEDNTSRAATYSDARLVRQPVRNVLRKRQMHGVEDLFDRAYVYIAEHYGQQSTPFPARAGREREGNNA